MNRNLLSKTAPPALPSAPVSPLKGFMDALNNVLRLFFNGVSSNVNTVVGENGGRFLQVPNGLFFDIDDQPLGAVNTAQPVRFNQTYLDNGVSINGATLSEITTQYSGVYNFQFTGQLRSGSSSNKLVFLWIARDGVDIGYSAREYSISGSGKELEINWNFSIDMQAGQYIQLRWAGDNIDLSLDAVAPASPHPGISSAVVSVTFVSALPEALPTPP
jgi:hypothetical protein